MIATLRGVLVLAILATLLAILVVIVKPPAKAAVDRSIVPSFDAGRVTSVKFFEKDAKGELVASRTLEIEKGKPKDARLDAGRVDSLLTALRAGRWHRRGDASLAGEVRAKLEVIGGPPLVFSVGQELAGTAQTWIVREDRTPRTAYLVDSWVANALAPTELELQVRRPFAMTRVTQEMLRKQGWSRSPNKNRTYASVAVRPEIVAQVQAALEGLELVALHGETSEPTGPVLLDVVKYGDCPGGRVKIGNVAVPLGCVERAAWDRVEEALAQLERPVEEIADPRPVPIAVAKVIVPDRKELVLTGRPRIDNSDTDPDAVEKLLVALATPGEIVERPTSAQTDAFLAIGADGAEVQLQLWSSGIIARRGEPIAIKTPHYAAIARTSHAYRDPTHWREDATTITSIKIDRVTYERGAVIGEWTRKPPGKSDNALVDALAQTLAVVRAPANPGNGKTTQGRKVEVKFTPPMGEPSTHTLLVNGVIRDGCRGRVDGTEVIFPPELCTTVLAVAAQK